MKYIGIDLETTGLNPETDKIIEAACVLFDDTEIIDSINTLINPDCEIPKVSSQLTGITNNDVKSAPLFKQVLPELKDFIGDYPIVGHNVNFDIQFLSANGLKIPNEVYDTFLIASILMGEEKSLSLEVIASKLNLIHEDAHRALDDTKAAINLYWHLKELIKNIPDPISEIINALLDKHDYSLKNHFYNKTITPTNLNDAKKIKELIKSSLSIQEKTKVEEKTNKDTKEGNKIEGGVETQAQTKKTLINDTKASITFFNHIDKLLNSEGNIILYNKNILSKKVIRNYYKNTHNLIPNFLSQKKDYISINNLISFIQKDDLRENEIHTILKVLMWLTKTKTGLLNELTFYKHEKFILPFLQENKETYFYKNAISTDSSNKLTFLEHSAINELLELPNKKHLFILHPGLLLQEIPNILSEKIILDEIIEMIKTISPSIPFPYDQHIEDFTKKIDIFFGLIGIFLEEQSGDIKDFMNFTINHQTQNFQKWKSIKESFTNTYALFSDLKKTIIALFKESKDLAQTKKALTIIENLLISIKEIIECKNPNHVYTVLYAKKNDYFRLTKTPIFSGKFLNDNIYSELQEVSILGNNTKYLKDNFFTSKELGIEDFECQESSESHLETNNTNTNTERNITYTFEEIENRYNRNELSTKFLQKIIKELKENKGNILAIASSEHEVKKIHNDLTDNLPLNEYNVLGMGVNGGRFKIIHQFNSSKKQTVLLITRKFLNFMESKSMSYNNIIIQKNPFVFIREALHEKRLETLQLNYGIEVKDYTKTLNYILLTNEIEQIKAISKNEKLNITFFDKL